jgi:DNA-3-methyladenine glycosylase I
MKEMLLMGHNQNDAKIRCFGSGQELYALYHDTEWGVPVHDDRHLFEMLILEGAQAGLSWETILKRRKDYQQAFYHFDAHKVAKMTDKELDNLCKDGTIVRNRLKIYSARTNAQVFLTIQQEYGSFDAYAWSFVHYESIKNKPQSLKDIPSQSEESKALSKNLKKRGMNFVGPTIIYAFMQAVGMVNDHIKSCWLSQKN